MRDVIDQKGQSLLELLVALLILVAALTATIALIVTSINAGRESRNKLIATSLAREGLEIVRNIRDSNWADPSATPPAWDDGLVGNPATPFIATGSPAVLYFAGHPEVQTQVKLYSDSYTQGTSASGTGTQFYRTLYLNSICHDASNNELIANDTLNTDACGAGVYVLYPDKVGIRVISEVHWSSQTSSRKVILEDRLYDWQVL